jgi:hypothetical protein
MSMQSINVKVGGRCFQLSNVVGSVIGGWGSRAEITILFKLYFPCKFQPLV